MGAFDQARPLYLQYVPSMCIFNMHLQCVTRFVCGLQVDRERTLGAAVLPAVLRQLFFMRDLLEEDSELAYTICAPSSYAYILRLHDVGGWNVDVHVNMWGGNLEAVSRTLQSCDSDAVVMVQPMRCPLPACEDVSEAHVWIMSNVVEASIVDFSSMYTELKKANADAGRILLVRDIAATRVYTTGALLKAAKDTLKARVGGLPISRAVNTDPIATSRGLSPEAFWAHFTYWGLDEFKESCLRYQKAGAIQYELADGDMVCSLLKEKMISGGILTYKEMHAIVRALFHLLHGCFKSLAKTHTGNCTHMNAAILAAINSGVKSYVNAQLLLDSWDKLPTSRWFDRFSNFNLDAANILMSECANITAPRDSEYKKFWNYAFGSIANQAEWAELVKGVSGETQTRDAGMRVTKDSYDEFMRLSAVVPPVKWVAQTDELANVFTWAAIVGDLETAGVGLPYALGGTFGAAVAALI